MTQQASSLSNTPAPALAPGVTSPEILPDHQVTFRIYASEARQVSIEGDWNTQGRGIGMVKLFYVAAGEDDQIIGEGARRPAATLARRGIRHEFHETPGGHTWINWRRYFYDFAQKLFR